ncbi:iron ABC transporter ATP-binding protein [Kroppenstedtia guangzhouensis]|jgi:iron complex transport system ATP-binding protein|uniref:Iron ABC transporter ATP-binding protein n=1 Tax=Kroppenstedtia guangzhouensis TaxID=1274356 RepID=A0ABQ1H3B7_9BACL|nr:ABC transporter ATP-binding protein [Kroppenstedtia guangzhouensis]GGA57143.1 iron ABC transporter ATP-binding protein [Kroppenstedtia guangzhouensis]
MIRVNHLFKKYGRKQVIEDVSIQIEKGKITSFIGPNGAGKSTLLSMISRLIAKDAGEITIDDQDLTKSKNRDLAKKISILKQSNFTTLRLTVRELVSFGRFPYSQGKLTETDWKHVDEAIRYLNLEDIQHRYLDQLSGGQQQRAYIAMVVAQDTEYILLDEPLNNLDMKHAVQIMKILRRLVDDLGKTVVIVIHDINFASCYSDHIVALKDGKVVREGAPHEMIHSSVLKEIYNMDFNVERFNNHRICLYYT